ncbi:MAG: acyl-CoA thioester hydrolase [Cryomorphaceae bacterium]|jgi:acyl-CoA thioester hydrolase
MTRSLFTRLPTKFMQDPLDRNAYFYFLDISTRWMDNDIYGHVNNVTYYSYFDTIANQYLIERGDLDIQNAEVVGFVVASNCQYLAPIAHPEKIDLGFRVNTLGSKSVEYGIAIFKAGESIASAHGSFTHVFVNRASGKSVAIPESIRQALELAII